MSSHISTDTLELADRMVNNTGRHIFLTGRAGTGKTTFLQNLSKSTHKSHLIVAPTGIAALNAGGVTIHSQFLLPFGSFLPGDAPPEGRAGAFYTRSELARKHPINSIRKKVLRNIELLIIDEVSMLRADVLDAIDYRLRSVKRNHRQSFGGVQVLMIGDLFQLPPIVKEQEWNVLQHFYKSIHFFEAHALRNDGFAYIELEKIFRQSDQDFIALLNNLRNNICSSQDLETLNAHYRPEAARDAGVITLTTHNAQAERINREELASLKSQSFRYTAEVQNDFPESLYPLPEVLELKVGAQVMFVKNDSLEKRFYNGKIAEVTKLSYDTITVLPQDEDQEIQVSRHIWENKKYTVNEATGALEEEVVGTFSQYPLKTAWAITVHKSQGLSFAKAFIDVGNAFAPGQVYVALSRLRSLDGLFLNSKIPPGAISNDPQVIRFESSREGQPPLDEILRRSQGAYLQQALSATFDFGDIIAQLQYVLQKMAGKFDFEDAEMNIAVEGLLHKVKTESENTRKFRAQISNLLLKEDYKHLEERIEKGSDYYLRFLKECQQYLYFHIAEVEMLSRTKTYLNLLSEAEQLIHYQMGLLLRAQHMTSCVAANENVSRNADIERRHKAIREALREKTHAYLLENPKNLKSKTGRKRKKTKQSSSSNAQSNVGETYEITRKLIEEGKAIEEIASERGLARSTIEGHCARLVSQEKLNVNQLLSDEEITAIESLFEGNTDTSLNQAFGKSAGKFSYAKLRMVQASMELKADKESNDNENNPLQDN